MRFLAAATGDEPGVIRDKAREILEREEFQRTIWDEINEFLADPIGAILGLLDQLLYSLLGNAGPASGVLAWVFVVVTLALVAFFVMRLVRTSSRGDEVALPSGKHREVAVSDLLADATRFEQQGRWREALRCRHAALIVVLANKGVVKRRPGVTAREYADEVARNVPAAASSIGEATALFEWVWYGSGEANQTDCDNFRRLSDDIKKQARA